MSNRASDGGATKAEGGAGAHGDEHHKAAEEGERGGAFAEGEEDPERIKQGLKHGDEHGLQGGDVADGAYEEEVGGAELHGAEEEEGEPAGGGQGGGGEDPREADEAAEEVAEDDGFEGGAAVLGAEGEGHGGEKDAAQQGEGVAQDVADDEAVGEEEDKAGENGGDGGPIEAGGPLAEESGAGEGDPDGRGVLEEDGVGGGGEFGRDAERDGAGGVGEGAEDLGAGEGEVQAARDEEKKGGGEQAARAGNGEGRPGDGLMSRPPRLQRRAAAASWRTARRWSAAVEVIGNGKRESFSPLNPSKGTKREGRNGYSEGERRGRGSWSRRALAHGAHGFERSDSQRYAEKGRIGLCDLCAPPRQVWCNKCGKVTERERARSLRLIAWLTLEGREASKAPRWWIVGEAGAVEVEVEGWGVEGRVAAVVESDGGT